MIPETLLAHLALSAGSTSISPAIICGMPILASLPTGSEHFARQQQAFARPLPPDRVPDPVLLTVLSCPLYGVTPEGRSMLSMIDRSAVHRGNTGQNDNGV